MIQNIEELPRGTKVRVNLLENEMDVHKDRFIEGDLTFQIIPDEFYVAKDKLRDLYDGEEDMMEYYDPIAYDAYIENKDSFRYGLSFVQPYDYNVEPRDIGKGSVKKGTPVVCYEYPKDRYELAKEK